MTDSVPASDVIEEHDGNVATGVEAEDVEGQEPQPWDPERIRVVTKHYTLREITDMINEGELELAPDFQRNAVWGPKQKGRLIESVLLRIPLPAFYFAEDADGMMRVIDGLQRLSTVHAFVRGDLRLTDLEYLSEETGKDWDDLSPAWRRRLNGAQIVVHVIEPTTPGPVKYDIFKRINTGGTPLNAQEVRHCMSGRRSRAFLKRCAEAAELHAVTGDVLRDHPRMFDREVALRFCAFQLLGDIERYRKEFGSIEALLDWATAQLDSETALNDKALDKLYKQLTRAMCNAQLIFGDDAFRKWPHRADGGRNPINRALFESWSVVLSHYKEAMLAPRADKIVGFTHAAMQDDSAYRDAITSSTGDSTRVEKRFRTAQAIVDSV